MRLELFTNYGSQARDAVRVRVDGSVSIPNLLIKEFGIKPNTAARVYTCNKTNNIAIEFNVKKGTENSRALTFFDYGATLNIAAALRFMQATLPIKKSMLFDVKHHEGMLLFNVEKMRIDLHLAA